ncbi:5-hydroxyisourate hydrolase, partial [Thalictrum thalictroides]
TRYSNRPIVELEIAAQEQMKITELRLAKLFATKTTSRITSELPFGLVTKAGEDRVSVLSSHLTAASEYSANKPSQVSNRTRPPITTHVLDVSRGSPAAGIEVQLEIWNGAKPPPFSGEAGSGFWIFRGSSITNADGRSGHLMDIQDNVDPGVYRISFNTGKYSPNGFFPYVSIVFEIKESQKAEHFHVPVLLSPFSFSTYRGS